MPQGKRVISLKQVKTSTNDQIKPIDKEKLLSDVQRWLQYEKRFSAHNIKNTMGRMRRVICFYGVTRPCQEDAIHIEESQRSGGSSNKTIIHYLTALELLAAYNGDLLKLRKPKLTVKQPQYLNAVECRALLEAASNKRERAILAILMYCGLRNKELCSLDIEDVDFNNRLLWIRDRGQGIKSRKERKAVMSQDCANTVAAWLTERQKVGGNALFITVYGDRINCDRLERIVRDTGRQAGLDKPVWPHLLRHSCGSNMIRAGIPITDVMIQLGHSDLSSTYRYLHGSLDGLKQSIDGKAFVY